LRRKHEDYFSLPKNPGVVKGRLPPKLIPALTACASEGMKTRKNSKKWRIATFSALSIII
jgi:hypothetical protein